MTRLLPSDSSEARRLRRLRDAFFFKEPSDAEILARLRQRKQLTPASTASRRVAPLGRRLGPVAAGLVLGILLCGTALAWGVSSGRVILSSSQGDSTSSAVDGMTPKSAPSSAGRHAPKRLVEPTALPVESTAAPAVQVIAREARVAGTPLPHKPRRTASTLAGRVQEPEVATRERTTRAWTEVAEALRRDDFVRARTALAPLLNGDDQAARQAARVLDLQLRLRTTGTLSETEWAEIGHLAVAAQPASVRASARRMLRESDSRRPNDKP